MAEHVTVDLHKARKAAEHLKANPPAHDEIVKDPQAFLAKLGVEVDHETLSTIKSKLAAHPGLASAPNQAMIVHIDT